MKDRIGIVGGTFDPIHNGHVVGAIAAREQLGFDRTLMIVAGDPWQKATTDVVAATHRLAMVELTCRDVPELEPSDIEVRRHGPSYTIDTVLELADPGLELFLVLGADAIAGLDTWVRADELSALVTIASLRRKGERVVPPDTRWNVEPVSMPRLDISSTDIRTRVRQGRSIDGLVPPAVARYIADEGLYR